MGFPIYASGNLSGKFFEMRKIGIYQFKTASGEERFPSLVYPFGGS
jgi:hypothetical protein